MLDNELVRRQYESARQVFEDCGVDVDAALAALRTIEISIHCWQGDDVQGLENDAGGTAGGILSTGSFPGKARNGEELRADIDMAMSLMPGRQRLNLHASYAELEGQKVDRDAYEPQHFRRWIDWARERDIAIDFNGTFFAHPIAADNLTLASPDSRIRKFWIRHAIASRKIAAEIGKQLGKTCIHNIWIPDGMKDQTANRLRYRSILADSLDQILEQDHPRGRALDALECKLFGLGLESYTVGSLEFYLGYLARAMAAGHKTLMPTLDLGHFHPTESVADKISALILFWPKLLIHVSRGVRWDSDHTVIGDDNLYDLMREIARADAFRKVYLATDFFDGSINRISAWVVGVRATQRAILSALLEPTELIRQAERKGRFGDRLTLIDEARSLPVGAVWNHYCLEQGVPAGSDYIQAIGDYEESVLLKRC